MRHERIGVLRDGGPEVLTVVEEEVPTPGKSMTSGRASAWCVRRSLVVPFERHPVRQSAELGRQIARSGFESRGEEMVPYSIQLGEGGVLEKIVLLLSG